jgi:replication initiation and membrane attachment protein
MENAWDKLTPKIAYQVFGPKAISQKLEQSLLYLYQPIVGMEGMSVYFLLLADCLNTGKSILHLHADLLTSLNMSIPAVYQARLRLEGIGLLDSYQKKNAIGEDELVYHLHEPLQPSSFFKEELLSYLLLSRVGKAQFRRLTAQFVSSQPDFSNLRKISKNFNEVYRWSPNEFAAESQTIKQVSEDFSVDQVKKPEVVQTFDWEFVENELKRVHLVLTKEQKSELNALQKVYGIDELTYVDYLRQAIDVTTQELQMNLLRSMLMKDAGIVSTVRLAKAKEEAPVEKVGTPPTQEAQKNFTTLDRQLLTEMNNTSPIAYLHAAKHKKHGFASKDEIWLVEDLMKRSQMATGVLNMLIDYVLIISNQPSLSQNYVNRIANDWVQKGIKTPEDAMLHLRKMKAEGFAKKQATSTKNKTYSNNAKRNVRREKLPDWVNKETKDQKITSEQAAELKRKLDKLKKGSDS